MNQYKKGATWRIWDLQIQTILDDRYESLGSYYSSLKSEDLNKWDNYVAKVGGEENAILFDSKEYFAENSISKKERCTNYVRNVFAFLEVYKPNLSLIGITDHNYYDDELLDVFTKYSENLTCRMLCGVEINVSGVHMLVYFKNPPYGKATFSEGIKTFLSKIDVDSPKKGNVLTVCDKSCRDVINEIKLFEGIFIYAHCNSNNGLFQERGKTDRTHLSDIFNLLPSIILQGNSKENIEKTETYIQSNPALFRAKAIYTTASDARCLNEFGNADKAGHYMWIKGDPIFDGLKQILFEPTSRTRISKETPEVKKAYLVIDKVRFTANTEKDLFSDDYIEINDKLNGIIGGKSSGKSILLYYIAKTIDIGQVERKIADSQLDLSYDFDKDPNFGFEVVWQDGVSYKLGDKTQDKSRQITYVPQMFINYLAEKGGQPELRKLIQEILEQLPEFKMLYDVNAKAIQNNKVILTAAIEKFYQTNDDLNRNSDSIKSKGDKKAREENIKQKNLDIDDLRKTAGFTTEDEQAFQALRSTQGIYTNRFTNINGLKNLFKNDYLPHLKSLKRNFGPSLNNIHINSIAKFMRYPLISEYLSNYILNDNQKINDLLDELISKAESRTEKLELLLNKNDLSLAKYRNLLAPFLDKIKDQQKLDDLNNEIIAEQGILTEIAELEAVRTTLLDTSAIAKKEFFLAYKNIFDNYKNIADTVNNNPLFSDISADKGIFLSSKIGFDEEKFRQSTIGLINSQSYLSNKIGRYIDGNNSFVYDEANHLANIEDFFEKLQNPSEHQIRFNQGGDIPTISKRLFQDFFVVRYELSQNDESILKMSPGKKGMILLFLILHLSNAEYPILIDQPEDNLDNRTVYKELKEFIKEKKIMRQIIMVTHNANLIVPTDAESVIVANQTGQDNSKDNAKFRFEYISGSLENSFLDDTAVGILNQMGIKEHVCDILEGGAQAFLERELKYDLKEVS